MSTCSITSGTLAAHTGPPPSHASAAEAPNGQHHLLRHVLSAQQCHEALRHFATTDSKAAARQVNRMSQRELRDMFAKVYSVTTNSNNNTWLRRKLLEAVGASRRFYNAASKAGGRPKARRAPAAPAPSTGKAAMHHAAAEQHQLLQQQQQQSGASTASLLAGNHPHQLPQQLLAAAAPPLPAGSPRALALRLRAAAQPQQPTAAHHYLPQPHRQFFQQQYSEEGDKEEEEEEEEEEEDTCSEGGAPSPGGKRGRGGVTLKLHPRALAPEHALASSDCGSPTSAFAAAAAGGQAQPQSHIAASGSMASLQSSQFAAFAQNGLSPQQGQVQRLPPLFLPSAASLSALMASLPSGFASQQAQQGQGLQGQHQQVQLPLPLQLSLQMSLGLPPAGSLDLAMWGSAEGCLMQLGAPPPSGAAAAAGPPAGAGQMKREQEDWLAWDNWQLPTLF